MKKMGLSISLALVIVLLAVIGSTSMVSAAKPPAKPTVNAATSVSASIDEVIDGYNMFDISFSWQNVTAYGMAIFIFDNNYDSGAGYAGSYRSMFGERIISYSYTRLPIIKSGLFPYDLDSTHTYSITLTLLGQDGTPITQTASTLTPQ